MLVDCRPKNFSDLLQISGLSHGTDVYLGNAKDLILSGTATVRETIGCRDDIMLYLISKGIDPKRAFKFMEAVRKGAIHKGKPWPDGIVEEMQQHGVPEWYIESCRRIQYLFPKAHAVAYVMMAFRIAWFKVHYPKEFYAAYFYRRSQKDSFDAGIMMGETAALRAKINEMKNDPNLSQKDGDLLTTLEACYEFRLRGFEFDSIDLYESDPIKFVPTEHGLRPPFVAVSGLGETAARDIAEKRVGRKFISIEELSATCPKLSKSHIEQLKALGAFGNLTDTSQISLF
jgi:DNA polymerase-3 subunit alpha (Gram-positive type)